MTTTKKRVPVDHLLQWERGDVVKCRRVRSRDELVRAIMAIAREIKPGRRAEVLALSAKADPADIAWGAGTVRIACFPATTYNLRARPHDRLVTSPENPPAVSREGKAAARLALDGEIRDVTTTLMNGGA
jgi:hypothetical protein